MKPTVHYRGAAVVIAERAYLVPIDHQNHVDGQDVMNEVPCRTSYVLSHDEATGRIETENTIYVPEVLPA